MRINHLKNCLICGKIFTSKTNQKFCSLDCRKKAIIRRRENNAKVSKKIN